MYYASRYAYDLGKTNFGNIPKTGECELCLLGFSKIPIAVYKDISWINKESLKLTDMLLSYNCSRYLSVKMYGIKTETVKQDGMQNVAIARTGILIEDRAKAKKNI